MATTAAQPSLNAEVTLQWGDGEYLFALHMKEIEELQKLCGAGFLTITNRVLRRECYIADIYHTIRLALIGGGMAPVTAKQKVDFYVDGRPLAPDGDPSSPLATAEAIMWAAVRGIEDLPKDEPGKEPAGTTTGSTSRPDEQKPSSPDGQPTTSTDPASITS